MTHIPDNLPVGTTHFCPAFGRFPDRAMMLRSGDNWTYWTGFNWFDMQWGPPSSVRREMIDIRDRAQWNGEGLPPVGLEVQARSVWGPYVGGWTRATLICASRDYVVLRCIGADFSADDETLKERALVEFRPIRTAEQIAAEEREAREAELSTVIKVSGWESPEILAAYLESHGYRKVEK